MRANVERVCYGAGIICAGLGIVRVFFPTIDALTIGLILGGLVLGVAPKFPKTLRRIRELTIAGFAIKFSDPKPSQPNGEHTTAPLADCDAPYVLVEAAEIAHELGKAFRLGEQLEWTVTCQQAGRRKDEAIINLMVQLAHAIAGVQHQWTRRCLASKQLEHRLVGYAAACRFPDTLLLPDLAATLADVEDHPFGRLWCVAAIGYCSEPSPERMDEATLELLEMCLTLIPLTDEAYRRLLAIVQRVRHGDVHLDWNDRDPKSDVDR